MHGDVLFFSVGRVWKRCGIYTDAGKHFTGRKTQDWLWEYGTVWIAAPAAAKKAVGLVEKCNDLLQHILKKISTNPYDWPLFVQESAKKKLHPAYRGPFVITGFARS
jgi:transposase InsO family protein